MPRLQELRSVALALVVSGCGARTSLDDGKETSSGSESRCPTWTVVSGPVALSEGSTRLGAAFVEDDRLFVAINATIGPSHETGGVLVASTDLSTIGPLQNVVPKGFIAGGASGFGHRAVRALHKPSPCVLTALAADGSPEGPVATMDQCPGDLIATPNGYLLVSSSGDPVRLSAIDASTGAIESTELPISAHSVQARRFDDGSLFLTWEDVDGTWGQHVTERGEPSAERRELPRGVYFEASGSGGLIAWSDADGIFVRALDDDGNGGPTTKLADREDIQYLPKVIFTKGGALVIWVTGDAYHGLEGLMVQPITPTGAPVGGPLLLESHPQWGVPLRTPNGAVALYDVEDKPVFAHALCKD